MSNLHPSPWCHSRGKRIFDVVIAATGLILALPAFVAAAIAIRISSRGPILFRQRRLGRHGKEFVLLKFRTMRNLSSGEPVTRAGDSRVTPVGRVLRATKIDELPQLVNVLYGDMSIVGPRPDLPEIWERADAQSRAVLALDPGITGAATLRFRNEESYLAAVPEGQLSDFYISRHLPRKAAIDLHYAARATFLSDCTVLVKTLLPFISANGTRTESPSYEPLPR